MERHERAMARQAQAKQLAARALETPKVNSVNDIKKVITELDPGNRLNMPMSDQVITTSLDSRDKDNRQVTYQVSAKTKTKTHRDIIIEGLDIIRRRQQLAADIESQAQPVTVNGRVMHAPPLINPDTELSIDPIIKRVTGGYRNGIYICWDLPDGYTYKYDAFVHRLTRIKRDDGTES